MDLSGSVALDASRRRPARTAAEIVGLCYSITGISVIAGVEDYTEGIYGGDRSTDYQAAQRRQHQYLLDELAPWSGFRLLEVGCGLGTLLAAARERGIEGTGITISEEQQAVCAAKGLRVLCADYRQLPADWRGCFDGIVVNGALEHFCQPEDALAGRQDRIYTEMFGIFAGLLDPASRSRRVVTTALHFRHRPVDPRKCMRSPLRSLFDPYGLHFSILHHGYGGYYPMPGQLARCAAGRFALVREVDGTQDYGFTTEDWSRKFRRALVRDPRFGRALLGYLVRRPVHTLWFTLSFLGPASQLWQFRGNPPPVQHFRHTWQRV